MTRKLVSILIKSCSNVLKFKVQFLSLPMERESSSMWQLSFVASPNHDTLDFKFLLKSKDNNEAFIVEEGLQKTLDEIRAPVIERLIFVNREILRIR
ncbi:hypothetical protein L1887_35164 [Cichorium endivia]|nr:hypothetical protein L1887_35164 [Cichorium endivia]